MIKLFKLPFVRFFFTPCVLFFVFLFSYNNYQKKIPVSFWDEVLWVGRSYFFEFFIQKDFDNKIWQSSESYDQPKLAEYAYGLWLYPNYLSEKKKISGTYDYTLFLIKNGFYEIDEYYMDNYEKYKNQFGIIDFDERMDGFPEDWVSKYGTESLKVINIIYQARVLNVVLLAASTILVYFLFLKNQGLLFSVIFSLTYGFNNLIMDTTLKAHSEGLFLFTFNAAILFMNYFFTKKQSTSYLLLFSLFAGLNISTKLNGAMLLVIFLVINVFFLKKEKYKFFFFSFIPVLVSLIIFIFLNPFVYQNSVENIKYMFNHRMLIAIHQTESIPDVAINPGIGVIKKIFSNFYFSDRVWFYNSINFFGKPIYLKYHGIYLFILFLNGIISSLKKIYQKDKHIMVVLTSFVFVLIFMSRYLIIDWSRYFSLLSLFIIFFQLFGLFDFLKNFRKNKVLWI